MTDDELLHENAGKAMQALLANPNTNLLRLTMTPEESMAISNQDLIAKMAYRQAKAMMAEKRRIESQSEEKKT